MINTAKINQKTAKLVRSAALTLVLLPVPVASLAAGPASPLYLTAGQENTLFVVQGTNIINSWTIQNNSAAIAVGNTVQITVGASGFPDNEYTLNGTPIGSSTFPNIPGTSVYDATSDGAYTYAWDFSQNRVLRFNSGWTAPVSMFSIGGTVGDFLGITFDRFNNSLWISGWNTSEIRDYTLSGQLLSSFTVSHDENAALALDPATDTLWLANRNILGQLEEYSTSGQLLDTESLPALNGMNILGGEFQAPEPATTSLLAVGLAVACLIKARTRS